VTIHPNRSGLVFVLKGEASEKRANRFSFRVAAVVLALTGLGASSWRRGA